MRRNAPSAVLLAAICLLPGAAAPARAQAKGTALALGATAPRADVKMKGVDGRELSIADVKGEKGTLVLFTCNACPWVQAWEERTVAIGNTWSKRGIGVIAINPNDPGQVPADDYGPMQERAEARGIAYPYVVDATSAVARAFGATRTPEAFLFDRNGKLVYHGTIDDNARQPDQVKSRFLEDALAALAAGKKVAVPETKSLGCSIKFRSKA